MPIPKSLGDIELEESVAQALNPQDTAALIRRIASLEYNRAFWEAQMTAAGPAIDAMLDKFHHAVIDADDNDLGNYLSLVTALQRDIQVDLDDLFERQPVRLRLNLTRFIIQEQ